MKEKVNKPRVFISYAAEDIAFIETIEGDLRRCRVEPWRDRTSIRHGQPWQQAIFEEGVPTCDIILAYFSPHSLNSEMFAKEVDAAQLRKLKDSGILFAPYISDSQLRKSLRLDIQGLECPVWNQNNYNEVLPVVVAEIWRSYMERGVTLSVLVERTRRLELELELQKINTQSSAFTPQEEKEFHYIYQKLNAPREISFSSGRQ